VKGEGKCSHRPHREREERRGQEGVGQRDH